MTKMVEIICLCGCGRKRKVRVADVNRGWGKFFNKSCKAKHQEKRTGQYKAYLRGNFSGKKKPVQYVEEHTTFNCSVAVTNKLYCNKCHRAIKKGSDVVFELTAKRKMVNAFCLHCSNEYDWEIYCDSLHPFSSEALGQY